MEYSVFGKSGKVCFVFPELSGHFYDFKNFGLLEAINPRVERGEIQIVCVSSLDDDSWAAKDINPRTRIENQERWFQYIMDEIVPQFASKDNKAMVTGCSMGGYHAGNFFFRHPEIFDVFLSLSGLFDARIFFNDYFDDLVYKNSPVHYLADMDENNPKMELYKQNRIVACVGQGLWEEELLNSTRDLDRVLTEKNIPHWFDYWGFDVSHDWCWWKKQLPYFLNHILGEN